MLACPFCKHVIPGAEKYLGKTGACPKCKGTYRFPATAARDFYDKAKAFIAIRREILERGYKGLIDILSNPATTQAQVNAHMQASVADVLPRLLTALVAADVAQKAFAKDVGLKLQ